MATTMAIKWQLRTQAGHPHWTPDADAHALSIVGTAVELFAEVGGIQEDQCLPT